MLKEKFITKISVGFLIYVFLHPPPPLGWRKLVLFRVYLGGLLMKKIFTCAVFGSAALARPPFGRGEANKGMYFQLRTGFAYPNNPDLATTDTRSIGKGSCRERVGQTV